MCLCVSGVRWSGMVATHSHLVCIFCFLFMLMYELYLCLLFDIMIYLTDILSLYCTVVDKKGKEKRSERKVRATR